MMRFNEPLFSLDGIEQEKELWRWLLQSPSNFYDCQMLLVDVRGDYYYTTDPLIFLNYAGSRFTSGKSVTFMTRTTATKSLTLKAYKLIVKDVKKWLPEKYDIIAGGGEDGADLKVRLDQYYELTGHRFHGDTVVLPGDSFRPTATVNIPEAALL